MKDIFLTIWHVLVTLFRLTLPSGMKAIAAEIVLLRHQNAIAMRERKQSPNLTPVDRFILGFCAGFIKSKRLLQTCNVVKPSTILKFQNALVERKYRLLFSKKTKNKPGPKGPSKELIKLVCQIKRKNPSDGYPRIADIVNNTFGEDIEPDVVRRILQKYFHPNRDEQGPSWLAFIGSTKDSLWSLDFFTCESTILRTHNVLVVLDVFTRRNIGIAINEGPVGGIDLCRMFAEATAGHQMPKFISHDNAKVFHFYRWAANMRILGIEEIWSVPYVPISHPFIESLIGKIRHEYLDQTLFWNKIDLERKLKKYVHYHNNHRVHRSICGQIPLQWSGEIQVSKADYSNYDWESYCNGMFVRPKAA